ncbi:MAG: gamma-glutamyl-gamma-aminobutyrate hydrolase family protein [Candidatus Dojkabacteria bacterium]|nr:gamma-glutamyl-gamma-aminobutyrate hydrolase family protein [Candidatus Dojkabacteria bacterium]
MVQKAKIYIPTAQTKLKPESQVYVHMVRETYIMKIIEAGGIPIVIPSIDNEDIINLVLDEADGILLTGGSDIDPQLYNRERHEKTVMKEPQRDIFEISLVQKAMSARIPILGICRGAQILAVANGGELYQHILDITDTKHGADDYDDLFKPEFRHKVFVQKDSKVFEIIKTEEIEITSAHHQAVKNPGKNMRIVGTTADGITEIIEHEDKDYFCIGFQGHIETQSEDAIKQIFLPFIENSNKY